jgi:hypothetical protein
MAVAAALVASGAGLGGTAAAADRSSEGLTTSTTQATADRRGALDAEAAAADRTVRLAVGGLVLAAVASGVLTWRYVVYTDPAKGYVRSRERRPVKRADPR